MKTKPQIFFIHGGNTHSSDKKYLNFLKNRKITLEKRKSWSKEYFDKKLGKKFQIIKPKFPLKENARYRDWKIHFEKHFPLLNDNIVLVGYSLGGIFLAKYLSENKFPKKIQSTYLIAPPFDNSVKEEELVGGFKLNKDLSKIERNSPKTTLMFSKKDNCVPVEHAKKYRKKLKNSRIIVYSNIKGHFFIEKFPEIIKMIGQDFKILKNNN